MSVISRQFAKDILLSTIFVLIVLIALFAFFDLGNWMIWARTTPLAEPF